MTSLYQEDLSERLIARLIPTDTLVQAINLLERFREVETFRYYVMDRLRLVIPAVTIIFLISIACALGIVSLIPDIHFLLILPAILLSATMLIGSLVVQLYVFFSWIEGRSLNLALGNRHRPAPGLFAKWVRKNLTLDMSPAPSVPWIFVALFVALPLSLLAFVWVGALFGVIAIALLMPVVYARFD